MSSLFITMIIGGSIGVLLGTAGAKIWAAARKELTWPEGANFLSLHLSSTFVITAEILVSLLALTTTDHRIAALALAVIYAGFVIGATTLRGQECGCFGIAGMRVGAVHIWGCALTAAVLLASALGAPEASPRPERLYVAVATAIIMTAAMQLWSRWSLTEIEQDDHNRLYVVLSPTCSACSALAVMENHHIGDSESDGTIRWIDRDSDPAVSLRDAGVSIPSYPAVVSLSTTDPATAQVASGLRECREVLQSWRNRQLVALA